MSNTSTAIKAIEHDGQDMIVEFQSGTRYRYPNVDRKVAENFANAPSKGQFFNRNLSGLYFEGERL